MISMCWFRSRLSYEQFSAFLANIKELNAQKQSREVMNIMLVIRISYDYLVFV